MSGDAAGHFLRNMLSPDPQPGPPYVHTCVPELPEAVVTRLWWFFYDVNIRAGAITLREGWMCPGRRWAGWKARRELAKWGRISPSWTVTL